MNLQDYRRYTAALAASLSADPRVLGLVALGSMAEQGRIPDEASDHDFFVIVVPGAQRSFREQASWLPEWQSISLFFQETPHGCKAVYASGHLVEFAVFDPEEIAVARVNDYRVLLDRAGVAERMARVASESAAAPPPDPSWLAGQFLTNALVASLRDRRGERLSAQAMLSAAVRHLAQLAAMRLPSPARPVLDSLDPLRRFEQAYPELAAQIDEACEQPPETAARSLLDLFERSLAAPEELPACNAVRAAL